MGIVTTMPIKVSSNLLIARLRPDAKSIALGLRAMDKTIIAPRTADSGMLSKTDSHITNMTSADTIKKYKAFLIGIPVETLITIARTPRSAPRAVARVLDKADMMLCSTFSLRLKMAVKPA